ncbi:hypothetical protein CTEN210_02006 [Chaetoceros tenuissimus]|uniref:Methyltransferase domain-containing protein n=1 Tax=Chaetoceros tenuissimus TaxID=426638 RepID=A0AAD3CG75_9STRA|nr:hypothetical protein CTEN210_02006 [Chaetoceros tenuissimus]
MQKEKTLQFWDDFYEKEEQTKEWIVQPSQHILNMIEEHLPSSSDVADSLHILEIGCGNSQFSLILWEYLNNKIECNEIDLESVHVTATDVSSVCIDSNLQRDSERMKKFGQHSFHYKILNVLQENQSCQHKFHLVLDKGCLDTFLFRSGKNEETSILHTLLDNVHSWLKDDGKYIIFSPRQKIKALRDYNGFASVEKVKIACTGDLDGKSSDEETIYIHICTKNKLYQIGDVPFRSNMNNVPDFCSSCKISFHEFRKGEAMSGKRETYWFRTWINHT